MAGNTFGKLGVVLALSHGNKSHRQQESRNYYRSAGQGKLSPLREYEMDFSTRSILTGITANFAYELTDNNRIQFQNFFSKDTSDESRFFEGYDSDGQQRVRNQRIRMIEEDVGSTKISGEHYLTVLGNSFLTWRLSYSLSSLDEPDLREALYEERNDRFLLADESQSGFRLFNDLDEDIWEPGLDWTTYFNHGSVNSSIKVGASYRSRQRDFLSRRFRFAPLRTAGIDLTQTPERIFTPRNIHPSGFELREETRPTDTYDAKQLTRAGYAMLDLSIDNWRFIGGARVEADSQRVETFDPFDRTAPTGVSTRLDNTDLLPAFSVVYRLDNDMNLRGGYGRTLNRPEFRELSPFEFTDVVGGRAVVGDPELVRARIQNWDFRWEWFMSSNELLSAGFFFKDFENPIERDSVDRSAQDLLHQRAGRQESGDRVGDTQEPGRPLVRSAELLRLGQLHLGRLGGGNLPRAGSVGHQIESGVGRTIPAHLQRGPSVRAPDGRVHGPAALQLPGGSNFGCRRSGLA